jgi:hypothetical protein
MSEKEFVFLFGEVLADAFSCDPASVPDQTALHSLGHADTVEDVFSTLSSRFRAELPEDSGWKPQTVGEAKAWAWQAVQSYQSQLNGPTQEQVTRALHKAVTESLSVPFAQLHSGVALSALGDEDALHWLRLELGWLWSGDLEEEEFVRFQTWGDVESWAWQAAYNDIAAKRKELEDKKSFAKKMSRSLWKKKISPLQHGVLKLSYGFGLLLFASGFLVVMAPQFKGFWTPVLNIFGGLIGVPELAQMKWSAAMASLASTLNSDAIKGIERQDVGSTLFALGMFIAVQLSFAIEKYYALLEKQRSFLLKVGYRTLFWLFLLGMAFMNGVVGLVGLLYGDDLRKMLLSFIS